MIDRKALFVVILQWNDDRLSRLEPAHVLPTCGIDGGFIMRPPIVGDWMARRSGVRSVNNPFRVRAPLSPIIAD